MFFRDAKLNRSQENAATNVVRTLTFNFENLICWSMPKTRYKSSTRRYGDISAFVFQLLEYFLSELNTNCNVPAVPLSETLTCTDNGFTYNVSINLQKRLNSPMKIY